MICIRNFKNRVCHLRRLWESAEDCHVRLSSEGTTVLDAPLGPSSRVSLCVEFVDIFQQLWPTRLLCSHFSLITCLIVLVTGVLKDEGAHCGAPVADGIRGDWSELCSRSGR